jgi:hypothetical protein
MPNDQKPQSQYVALPDGSYAEFPASMSDEQITGVLKTYHQPQAAPAGPSTSAPATPVAQATAPPVKGLSLSAAPPQSLYDRFTQTLRNSAVGSAVQSVSPKLAQMFDLTPTETVYSPQYQQHQQQIIAPDTMLTPTEQRAHPIATGALQFGGGLSQADNMLMMMGLPESRIVSGAFSLSMLKGMYEQSGEFKKAWDANDISECQRIGTQMMLGGWMAKQAAQHAITGGPALSPTDDFIKNAPPGVKEQYKASAEYAGSQVTGGADVPWLQSQKSAAPGVEPHEARAKAVIQPEPAREATVPQPPSQSVQPIPTEVAPTPKSAQATVEAAGGVYRGENSAGLVEVTLPREMTKDMPIDDRFKDRVSVTLDKKDLTEDSVQAAMARKVNEFSRTQEAAPVTPKPEPLSTLPTHIQDSLDNLVQLKMAGGDLTDSTMRAKTQIKQYLSTLTPSQLLDLKTDVLKTANQAQDGSKFITDMVQQDQFSQPLRDELVKMRQVGETKSKQIVDPGTGDLITRTRESDPAAGPLGRSLYDSIQGRVPRVTMDNFTPRPEPPKGSNISPEVWQSFTGKMVAKMRQDYNSIHQDMDLVLNRAKETDQNPMDALEQASIFDRIRELEGDARKYGNFPAAANNPGRRPVAPVEGRDPAAAEGITKQMASRMMGKNVDRIPSPDEFTQRANELAEKSRLHRAVGTAIDAQMNKQRGAIGEQQFNLTEADIPAGEKDFSSKNIAERARQLGLHPFKTDAARMPDQDGWWNGDVFIPNDGFIHYEVAQHLLPTTDVVGDSSTAMYKGGWMRWVQGHGDVGAQVGRLDSATIKNLEKAFIANGQYGHQLYVDYTTATGRIYSLQIPAGWDEIGLSEAIAKEKATLKIPSEAGASGAEIAGGMGIGGTAGLIAGGAVGGPAGAVIGVIGGTVLGAVSPDLMRSKPVVDAWNSMKNIVNGTGVSTKDWFLGNRQMSINDPDMEALITHQRQSPGASDMTWTQRLTRLPLAIQRKIIDRFALVNDQAGPFQRFILRADPIGRLFTKNPITVDDSPYVTLRSAAGYSGGARAISTLLYRGVIEDAAKSELFQNHQGVDYLDKYLNLKGFQRAYEVVLEHHDEISANINDIETKLQSQNITSRQKIALEDDLADAKAEKEAIEYKIGAREVAPRNYDPQKIQAGLQQMEQELSPQQHASIVSLANRVFDQNRQILDLAHDNGIVSDANYQTYIARGNEYIPMTRILDDFSKNTGRWSTATSPYYLHQQHVIKMLEGSVLDNQSPILASAKANGIAINECVRNMVIGDFLRAGQNDPEGIGKLFKPVSNSYKAQKGEALVGHYEDGVPKTYAVPEQLGQTLQGASPMALDLVGGAAARWIANVLRKGATAGNLAYTSMRALRDTMGAAILSEGGISAKDPLKTALDMAPIIGKSWRDNFIDSMRKGPGWQEYMKSGGAFGALQRQINPEHFISLDKLGFAAKVAKGRLIDTFSDFNASVEDAIKMTTFQRLRENGYSVKAAQWEMRRYGGAPDYSRQGEMSPAMNLAFMFFNAKLQDTSRVFAKMAENPARMGVFLGGLSAMVLSAAEWNNSQKDENGKPLINKIDQGDRDRNFVVLLGGTYQTEQGPKPYRIMFPKPDVVRLLINPLEDAINKVAGREDRSGTQLALNEINRAIPGQFDLQQDHILKTAAQGAAGATNPLIRVLLEQAMNHSMQGEGGPIIPEREQKIDPKFQYGMGTTPVAKAMGQGGIEGMGAGAGMMGAIGGMYYGTPGAVVGAGIGAAAGYSGLSPRRIDHFLRGTTAGAGAIAASAVGTMVPQQGRTPTQYGEDRLKQVPVVGQIASRFIGSSIDQEEKTLTEKFYNSSAPITQAFDTVQALKKRDPNLAMQYEMSHQELVSKGRMVNEMQQRLAKLNSKTREIQEAPADVIDDASRQQALTSLHDARLELLRAYNGILSPTPSGNVNTGWSPMGTTAK